MQPFLKLGLDVGGHCIAGLRRFFFFAQLYPARCPEQSFLQGDPLKDLLSDNPNSIMNSCARMMYLTKSRKNPHRAGFSFVIKQVKLTCSLRLRLQLQPYRGSRQRYLSCLRCC